MSIDKSNHGKVGYPLYVKFTVDAFISLSKANPEDVYDGKVFSAEEMMKKYHCSSVPVHIDNTTKGDYEVVCEFGTEIHVFSRSE
ncbi:hypothetical protein [Brevibacillus laterosporus]|uniref:hypothetical protein n=1 Tax=Brevibacillus laterosporus TaxID=1465 RepID=UPI00215BAB47|nr:hypothetical protein [Brevibacillus laterosporus]MCR8994721.1 hypothetical protein [Brevibacillus laterosporus]